MKVVYWGKAKNFYKKHKNAESALKAWKKSAINAQWTDFNSVKQTFNTADWFEGMIIFDIKGNDFRLISICVFENDRIYIKEVLTHQEYEKGTWKKKYRRF